MENGHGQGDCHPCGGGSGSETLTGVAASLAGKTEDGPGADSGYAVSAQADKIVAVNVSGVGFSLSLVPSTAGAVAEVGALVSTKAVELAGGAKIGETWSVVIQEGATVKASATHTVTLGTETLASIAGTLAAALEADLAGKGITGYAVVGEGETLLMSHVNGLPTFTVTSGVLREDRTDGVIRELGTLKTVKPEAGGDDTILGGDGSNVVIGGFGSDEITTGVDDDVVIGDNGEALYTAGVLSGQIRSTDTDGATGGGDVIDANAGNNVVLGGVGADTVTVLEGSDVILGDNGGAEFDAAGALAKIASIDLLVGGGDVILSGDGRNVVIGGFGSDEITTGVDDDVVIGDNGEALLHSRCAEPDPEHGHGWSHGRGRCDRRQRGQQRGPWRGGRGHRHCAGGQRRYPGGQRQGRV